MRELADGTWSNQLLGTLPALASGSLQLVWLDSHQRPHGAVGAEMSGTTKQQDNVGQPMVPH
jgi:hypothetical protein